MTTEKVSIKEFYKDKTILISGGTGFLGKVLIEKLLRSCDGVKRILILLRSKKGKTIDERLKSFKQEVVFQRIQKTNPEALDKLMGIAADLSTGYFTFPNDENIQQELQQINIIFHCAASVRFDDPLKKAMMINVCATKAMLDFAKTLSHLDCFMHVSTAYSNCDRFDIHEKLYPAYLDWSYAIKIAESFDEDILSAVYPKLAKNVPNTYVYTKNIAETMVNDYKDVLPVVVYRPSIVTSAEKEPFPGFIDNFNGPIGLFFASTIGINRTAIVSPNVITNNVPVDACIKGMIIAVVKHASSTSKKDLPIINAASIKTPYLVETIVLGKKYIVKEFPPNMMFWRDGGRTTVSVYEHYTRVWLTQLIPALVTDIMLKICNKGPRFLKLQRVLMNAQTSLQYFMNNTWNIENKNFLSLNNILLNEELNEFQIKEEVTDYVEYLKLSMLGARRYLLNWPDDTLEDARKLYHRMVLLDKILKYLLWTGIILIAFPQVFNIL